MERYTKESLPKEMQCKSGLYDLSSFYHVFFQRLLKMCCKIRCLFRFPIAIKSPRTNKTHEIDLFLDEAKSMLEIGSYHENIVNLQGISYTTDSETGNIAQVLHNCNIY